MIRPTIMDTVIEKYSQEELTSFKKAIESDHVTVPLRNAMQRFCSDVCEACPLIRKMGKNAATTVIGVLQSYQKSLETAMDNLSDEKASLLNLTQTSAIEDAVDERDALGEYLRGVSALYHNAELVVCAYLSIANHFMCVRPENFLVGDKEEKKDGN